MKSPRTISVDANRTGGRGTAGFWPLVISLLVLSASTCAPIEVERVLSFSLTGDVYRATASFTDKTTGEQNDFINVQDRSVDWSEGVLYGFLLPADVYDAPDAGEKKENLGINEYGYAFENAQKVANPFDVTQNAWLQATPPDPADPASLEYETIFRFIREAPFVFTTLMSPVVDESPVAVMDFQGVEEGIYDLLLWADVTTEPVEDADGNFYSSRGTGCLPEDGEECQTREEHLFLPSNGDVVYIVDNVLVDEDHAEKNGSFFFPGVDTYLSIYYPDNSPSPNPCAGTSNTASGDLDYWDEWVCLTGRYDLSGDPEYPCGKLREECWDSSDNRRAFPDTREESP